MTDDDTPARERTASRSRLYDVDQARHSRLVRLDAKITRCPHCGAWTWLGTCTTPLTAHKEQSA